MKKFFTYTVSLIMAALIVYGGAGVNMILYCCNLCSSEGIEAVSNNKCCEIHHHHHTDNHQQTHHTSGCCEQACNTRSEENQSNPVQGNCDFQDDHSAGNSCSFERINFDWSVQNFSKQGTGFSPLSFDLFSCNLYMFDDLRFADKIHSQIPHGPPIVLPRDYLSILTVLLI